MPNSKERCLDIAAARSFSPRPFGNETSKRTKWFEMVLWKEESSSWGADSSEEEDEDPSLAISFCTNLDHF